MSHTCAFVVGPLSLSIDTNANCSCHGSNLFVLVSELLNLMIGSSASILPKNLVRISVYFQQFMIADAVTPTRQAFSSFVTD